MMRFAQYGADAPEEPICVSQSSSMSTLRAFAVGNAPMTPARHAATTSSGPLTRSIGAAMSGSRRRLDNCSGRAIELAGMLGQRSA